MSQTHSSPPGAAPFSPVAFLISSSFFSNSRRIFGLKKSTNRGSTEIYNANREQNVKTLWTSEIWHNVQCIICVCVRLGISFVLHENAFNSKWATTIQKDIRNCINFLSLDSSSRWVCAMLSAHLCCQNDYLILSVQQQKKKWKRNYEYLIIIMMMIFIL